MNMYVPLGPTYSDYYTAIRVALAFILQLELRYEGTKEAFLESNSFIVKSLIHSQPCSQCAQHISGCYSC